MIRSDQHTNTQASWRPYGFYDYQIQMIQTFLLTPHYMYWASFINSLSQSFINNFEGLSGKSELGKSTHLNTDVLHLVNH